MIAACAPAPAAAQVWFAGQWVTASCSEVEFFLIDPDTMLFGLNNRVFTVRRVK